MAIFTPGPAVAQISGSVGGTTFSRNKGGAYMRMRGVPTNPDSLRQQDVRSDFATLVSDWILILDQGERDGWNDFAEVNPVINSLGQTIFLSGQQWYIKVGVPLKQAGLVAPNDAPPAGSSPPPDTVFSITQADPSVNDMNVAFDATQPWVSVTGAAMLIYMGKPQSPGTSLMGIPFRLAEVILGDTTTPPTSPVIIDPTPYNMSEGDRVVIEGRVVLPLGGQTDRFRSNSFIAQE